ncbi:MAG: hypothetical protein Q8N23_27455 [Archangium sp.]|nr:hypothetical protein [Archangium sp.]MDP3156444.1 hypothetical protein [Archangium sp.]MDP3573110.1 hypothetical protein [Archangium sp.]
MSVLLALLLTSASPEALLATAKEQLARHDDVAARRSLEKAVGLAAVRPNLLAEIYLHLGLAWAEAAEEAQALNAFATARKLDKALRLPRDLPPKIQDWWRRVGGEVEAPDAPVIEVKTAPLAPPAVALAQVETPPAVAPPSRPLWWIAPVVLGASAAVAGALLAQQSEARYQRLSTGTVPPGELSALVADGKGLQTGAWVSFGAAAGLGIASVITFVVTTP